METSAVDRRARRLSRAVWTVSLTGLLVFVATAALEAPRLDWTSGSLVPAYLFASLLVVGELRPLLVARDDGDPDTVTVSTTFAVALVITGPLLLAMLAQAVAVGYDDVRRRRSPMKIAFNISQYLVTLAVARAVYCLLSGRGLLDAGVPLEPRDVVPGLVAGACFFVVNNGLVAVIVAIATGRPPWHIVRGDLRAQGLASSILVALAPLSAVAADFSLLTVPLVVLPLLGVQHSADLAARRQHEALHDALTGLPNRVLLRRRAQGAVEDAVRARAGGEPWTCDGDDLAAVMLLDLDHFKDVNDTLGHHVGDALLREVATRLTATCPEDVTVSRLGGDEFAVLVPATSVVQVTALADRVCEALRGSAVVDGVRIAIQSSVGVALAPVHADSVEGLLKRADIALYRAKENRGTVAVYHEDFDTNTVQRLSLVADLGTATEDEQMWLAYQPLVDAASRRVVGVEALMRWTHPTHGAVPPAEFVALAERSGAITTLTRHVLERGLRTTRTLLDEGRTLSLSVNLSARLLSDLALPDVVADALERNDVPAELLTIEVTESTIAADPRRAMELLQRLRVLGVRLSVDDFGTGYSSLSYLSRLQPDELKVDRSFVRSLRTEARDEAIVRSTIELGHSLGMEVVAEGVEDEETYAALLALGCDRIQGYLFGRPLPEDELRAWLDRADAAEPGLVGPGAADCLPRQRFGAREAAT